MIIEKEAKKKTLTLQRHFTNSAREGLLHILKDNFFIKPKKGILLPAYIGLSKVEGSGIFDPVKKSKIKYNFYKLNKKLVPNLSDIKKKLSTGKFSLILLVHYFGCCQTQLFKFIKLCKEYNVKIIEDCAHSLQSGTKINSKLGKIGDYSIFSIHKTLHTRTGGFYYDLKKDLRTRKTKIDKKVFNEFALTDINDLLSNRYNNFKFVYNLIKNKKNVKNFFDSIPVDYIPLNCPIIVKEGFREKLYLSLIKNSIIPTALYHTLIKQVYTSEFKDTVFLSKNILNLPTHQNITKAHYLLYKKNFLKSLKETFNE
jgi:dTDP-4-amino-4,6-dideoxygalactose transaminase